MDMKSSFRKKYYGSSFYPFRYYDYFFIPFCVEENSDFILCLLFKMNLTPFLSLGKCTHISKFLTSHQ